LKKISQGFLILALTTFLLFLINSLTFTLSSAREKLYTRKARYYQWKFGKVFYTVQGSGKSVLLIHDSSTYASSYEFHRILNALSKNYQVYALDLLGYGRSDKPKITYTAYLFVQLIMDFRKDIIQKKTSIITSGKSNAFATMACFQNPKLFRNLIFINPTSLDLLTHNPTKKDKLFKFILELPIIGTSIYTLIFSKFNIKKSFKENFYNPHKIKHNYILAYNESAHLGGSSAKFTYASQKCSYTNVGIHHALARINNNISIIQGNRLTDHDTISQNYKTVNGAIESSAIDQTCSFPHLERPESTLELLSIYLH